MKNVSGSYKSAARTKENSVERLSHSVDRGGDEGSKGGEKLGGVEGRSKQIVDKLNEKMLNRIAGLFYKGDKVTYFLSFISNSSNHNNRISRKQLNPYLS